MFKYAMMIVLALALGLMGCGASTNQDDVGIPGPPGPKGDTGEAGAKGDTGAKGEVGATGNPGETATTTDGFRITESILCNGGLDGLYDNYRFRYNAIAFQNGNVYADGSIRNGALETSSTSLYAPTQNGWVNAPVLVQHDRLGNPNGGWWELFLNRTTLETTIQYHDADEVDGIATWSMPSGNCVHNKY